MADFNVLLVDGIDETGIEILRQTRAIDVLVEPRIDREKLIELIPDIDGLVVRSATRVDAELMEKSVKLRVIGRAGVGVDNVDLATATARGILVMNSPDGSDRKSVV